jgi:hypothetical protein
MNVSMYLYVRLVTSIVLLGGLIVFARAEILTDQASVPCETASLDWMHNCNTVPIQPSP